MSNLLETDEDNDGTPDYKKGDVVMTFAFKFGEDVEIHKVTVGQPNSKIITNTDIFLTKSQERSLKLKTVLLQAL